MAVGLIVLVFVLALMILFSPIFFVFILPCIVVVKCRQITNTKAHVIKMTDGEDDSVEQEEMPLKPTNFVASELQENGAAAVIREQPKRIEEESSIGTESNPSAV